MFIPLDETLVHTNHDFQDLNSQPFDASPTPDQSLSGFMIPTGFAALTSATPYTYTGAGADLGQGGGGGGGGTATELEEFLITTAKDVDYVLTTTTIADITSYKIFDNTNNDVTGAVHSENPAPNQILVRTSLSATLRIEVEGTV